MNDFFKNLDGLDEKPTKGSSFILLIFLLIAIVGTIWMDKRNLDDIAAIVICWYVIFLFYAVSLFIIASYLNQWAKRKNKFITATKKALILTLFFLAVVFLPISIFGIIADKARFNNLFRYSDVYIFSIFIPMMLALLGWALAYLLIFIYLPYLNESTLSALLGFVFWRFGSLIVLRFYLKVKKIFEQDVYETIKQDLYVFVFVMITGFTIIANCFKLSGLHNDMVKGFTNAFAIYIAIDRLNSKWKKANSEKPAAV